MNGQGGNQVYTKHIVPLARPDTQTPKWVARRGEPEKVKFQGGMTNTERTFREALQRRGGEERAVDPHQ